jgi:hypothetical protein
VTVIYEDNVPDEDDSEDGDEDGDDDWERAQLRREEWEVDIVGSAFWL